MRSCEVRNGDSSRVSSHGRDRIWVVFAGGAPGARTLNPRIKRGPLRRSERPACTNVPGICPESTQCTGMRLGLVPRAVPRHPCQTRPPRLLNVTTRRRRRLGPWFLFHLYSGSIRRQPDRGGQQHALTCDVSEFPLRILMQRPASPFVISNAVRHVAERWYPSSGWARSPNRRGWPGVGWPAG